MPSEKLQVILELVTGNYKREAGEAATATGRIGNAANGVTSSLRTMVGPAVIGAAITSLATMALKAGENADRLFDLQAQTGLSTDALQEWEFVAKTAGATTEVFADSVKAVIRNLSGTEGATGAAAKAYDTLGISVLDAGGNLRDAGSITDEVFAKLAGMENITARNALAQDIFGKKWEETVSILDLGSEALGKARKEAAGGVISAESLRNADKFRETWQKFVATVGPKLNELLGDIAPALTQVADGAISALDALEPLIDVVGAVAGKFGEANDAIEAGRDSPSKWAQSWAVASDIGGGAIFGIVGILGALFDEENVLRDNTGQVTGEIHDSWATLGARFTPIAGTMIDLINRQGTAMGNAATAADTQRTAMINLFNAQADLLDPVGNVIRLTDDLQTAQENLTVAQADGETPASDLALAAIAVEQAFLRLQSAGAALTPDQIQAFSQVLMSQLGMSETQALETLGALDLLDGWTGSATFTLNVLGDLEKAIGGAISNTGVQVRQHGGRVSKNQPYLVGERGPELMVPNQNGMVLPNGWTRPNGPTINVISPTTQNLAQDLQLATILATVNTMVEVQG